MHAIQTIGSYHEEPIVWYYFCRLMVIMAVLWIVCGVIIALYGALWYYFKYAVWCRSKTCLVGKTAIVTGANTGIGYHTALDFAQRGARVILACRSRDKAERAQRNIIEETGNHNIVVKIVNLASFDSVRAFVRDVNDTEERLDILVNNAGAAGIGDKRSQDGLVLLMQVNYFSSFLLTNLLLGLLKKSAPSRIINLSSLAAKYSDFRLEDLNQFTGICNVYANSKLCNILFTMELARRLEDTKVSAFSVHPGAVDTDIFRHIRGFNKRISDFLRENFFKTSEEGAQTTIYTAVAKGIEDWSGEHFDNCKRVDAYPAAEEPDLPKKLWEKTQNLVQLKPEEVEC